MVSSVDDIVLSIISLVVNTCSVIDLFLRYAAWDMGIAKSNLQFIFFIIQTANIFIRTDKRIIGQRFYVGLFLCSKSSARDFILLLPYDCNIVICNFFKHNFC